jgi:Arc/MetJ-type ribon-helix-helix transcriptional regulator
MLKVKVCLDKGIIDYLDSLVVRKVFKNRSHALRRFTLEAMGKDQNWLDNMAHATVGRKKQWGALKTSGITSPVSIDEKENHE